MSRNSSGTYSLPVGDQSTGNTITASIWNSNFDDIASTLTTSLATTGVSSMTGAIKATSGSAAAPGYTFGSGVTNGFYLAGTNQIGLATNGIQAVTFNSDQSVTWAGNQTFGGTLGVTGASTFSGTSTFNGNATVGAVSFTVNATSVTFNATGLASFWTGLAPTTNIQGVFDGGGGVIGTSNIIMNLEVPFACTITRWTVIADVSTTSTINVYRANAALPTSGGTITGGSPPSITGATYNSSTSLGAWTTTLAARDVIQFAVTANSAATKLTVSLIATRTGS